jgi:general secretion pathway protein L
MSALKFLIRWIDVLAGLAEALSEIWRGRRALVVRREGERFLARWGDGSNAAIVLPPAGPACEEIVRRAAGQTILLEWPFERTVIRNVVVPAQAGDFLSGIVRNQIERLSPWPAAQVLHCYVVEPSGQPGGNLKVRVLIASRSEIENARGQLGDLGLAADRVIAAPDSLGAGAAQIALWSRNGSNAHPDRKRLRLIVGGAIGGLATLSATLSLWAFTAAGALQEEGEEIAARAQAVLKRAQAARSPQSIAALSPPERAWIGKETSVSALFLLEALSRALPDGAYLTELQFEDNRLRIMGLCEDAPPLIGALEKSKRFENVHFSASTTRGPDGRLFRFSIEAQVAPRPHDRE